MKYIIDVEKIEGTNLWKAKEFNALVFDKNGLMRMMTLEDELGDYYIDLRNEVEKLQRQCKRHLKTLKELREEKKCVWNKLDKEKNENEEIKEKLAQKQEVIEILLRENQKFNKENQKLKESNEKLSLDLEMAFNECLPFENECYRKK